MKHYIDEFKKILFYCGLHPDEYKRIESEIKKGNLQNLKIFSFIAVIFLAIMLGISFFASNIILYKSAYFIPGIVILFLFILSKCNILKESYIVYAIYVFIDILYIFGCILGTVADPYGQSVTFVALLLTVPLLYTDRPVRAILNNYLFIIIFIIMALVWKDKSVILIDIINVCVFGTISAVISSYMIMVKCQRYFYEHEVAVLSETDLLTGLNNRNSFERMIKNYPNSIESSLSCIYADANGLHELNNTKGHEAGDKMLRCIADILKKHFMPKDIYRIGGDEFVAFAMDTDPEALERKINEIKLSVEKNGYSASIGYDMMNSTGIDMDKIIKNAEKRMYDDKTKYYDNNRKTSLMRRSGRSSGN